MGSGLVIRAEAGQAGAAAFGAGAGTARSGAVAQTGGGLQAFEGFLKTAGHAIGVALADVVKYALPIASVVSVGVVPVAPAEQAFAASLAMVLNTVLVIEQRWSTLGAEANPQRLADVLEIVEGPIETLFAQAGYAVDAAYVINLVNGVVALLNAQPAVPQPGPGVAV